MKALLSRLNKVKLLRYLVSGGTATMSDLVLLYAFTDFMHIWYVISVALAFIVAFMISFVAQKFWTFQDHSLDKIHTQGSIYFVVAVVSLAVNTYAVYFLVTYIHLYYIIAQIIVSALIAVANYVIYSKFIFRQQSGIIKP
jgi:putative flippase GtrA